MEHIIFWPEVLIKRGVETKPWGSFGTRETLEERIQGLQEK